MVSIKSKIIYSVKVSKLEFVSLPIVVQLQPNFFKLPCVEQRITKLDLKSTMYSVVTCSFTVLLQFFYYILFCVHFSNSCVPVSH